MAGLQRNCSRQIKKKKRKKLGGLLVVEREKGTCPVERIRGAGRQKREGKQNSSVYVPRPSLAKRI
jgi:hypothetical protein